MADDRLPWRRSVSIDATRSDSVTWRDTAMSLRLFQNASSRLTLVLWPAMTIQRLTTGDFIAHLPFQSGVGRGPSGLCRARPAPGFVLFWGGHKRPGWRRHRL